MKQALAIWVLTTAVAMAQSTVSGSKTMQGSWDASGASATKPAKSGTSLPATCGTGEFFFNTAASAGQNLYLCNPANTWTQVSAGVNSVFGRTGAVAAQTGDYNFSQLSGSASSGQLPAAGGDISGTLTSATVKGIQGKTVSATAPSSGQVLTWNGSQWIPQAVSSSVGGDLSGTTAAATVQAIQGQPVATTTPVTGQVLTWSGSSWGAQNSSGGSGGSSVTERALIFDGSTSIAGETMTSWSCGSGSASICTTSWTVPAGVNFVRVQIWSAGGSGSGSYSGGQTSGGGGGGGYWEGQCPVTPSTGITVTVGNGGTSVTGFPYSNDGGNSSFGTCATVIGGMGGNGSVQQWGGYLSGTRRIGWIEASNFNVLHTPSDSFCSFGNANGSETARFDGGGCGAGNNGPNTAGATGGNSINGGGGGGTGGSTGGAGGVSALGNTLYVNGGNGGIGGAWTSANGVTACTAGNAPGGGGGSGATETTGGANLPGCNGARGEIRVYYAH